MSKPKRRPTQSTSAKPRPAAPQPAPRGRKRQPMWLLAAVGALALLIAAGFWFIQPERETAAPTTVTTPEAATPSTPPAIGATNYCRHNPRFGPDVGLSSSINVSTNERMIKGLVMFNSDLQPEQVQLGAAGVYQHPSWDDAGYLGPVATDEEGNIYVAPSPRVSLLDNPPELANRVFKVDTRSGEMKLLASLPAPQLSSTNPYGVLGLIYDCDTRNLYVSSVAGSTHGEELGRLYRIDPETGAITDQRDGVDALSVAIFNGSSGKRLYYGSARAPEIRSVGLDQSGAFIDQTRTDIILSEVGPRLDLRARRITFETPGNTMSIRGVEFYYTLIAMSEARSAFYQFAYDSTSDSWNFLE